MIKIGIIGSENTHASAFAKIFNQKNKHGNFNFEGFKVTAVGGNNAESSKKIKDEYGVDFIADKPEDMLGKVDAVMITERDGKHHAAAAYPFIEAGIPLFIDKPFTVDSKEAIALTRAAKAKKVAICGGSSVKMAYDVLMLKHSAEQGGVQGGVISAPLSMENDYSNFYFYSSHLAETSLTIFGYRPNAVSAYRNGDNVTVLSHYDDYIATGQYVDKGIAYYGAVFTKDKVISRAIDISLCYAHECQSFVDMVKTGIMPQPYEELVIPVYFLNAVEKAYKTGGKVKLEAVEI